MKRVLLGFFIIGLVGCASEPAQPYIMNEQQVQEMALKMYATDRCNKEGKMTPETAADGMRLLAQSLRGVHWPDDRVKREISRLHVQNDTQPLPQSVCNNLAMKISMEKPKSKPATINVLPPVYNTNKHTICNSIGTQTFCSSY